MQFENDFQAVGSIHPLRQQFKCLDRCDIVWQKTTHISTHVQLRTAPGEQRRQQQQNERHKPLWTHCMSMQAPGEGINWQLAVACLRC